MEVSEGAYSARPRQEQEKEEHLVLHRRDIQEQGCGVEWHRHALYIIALYSLKYHRPAQAPYAGVRPFAPPRSRQSDPAAHQFSQVAPVVELPQNIGSTIMFRCARAI